MRPRPVLHETEADTKTNYCETETETKKVVSDHVGLETLTSLVYPVYTLAIIMTKLCLGEHQTCTLLPLTGFPLYFGCEIQGFSRTLKLHFQGPIILHGSLQHGQYYTNI